MDILFVQGAGAYDEDTRLASSLQKSLGSAYTVHYPRMPDEDAPVYAAWKAKILEELATLEGAVILAGHSLGASLLIKIIIEEGLTTPGLFLAGTPYWEIEDYALPEDFASSLPPDLPIFLYHSRDDEWVPFGHQARYAEKLPQAVVRTFETRGHQFGDDLSEMAEDIRLTQARGDRDAD